MCARFEWEMETAVAIAATKPSPPHKPAETWITPPARSSGDALLSRTRNGLWLSDLTAIPATLRIGRSANHNRVVTIGVASCGWRLRKSAYTTLGRRDEH